MAQSHFVLEYRSQLYALGMRTTSVMLNPNDYNAVEFNLPREGCARRACRPTLARGTFSRHCRESRTSRAEKEDLRLLSERVAGGKIASGRVWSQDQLLAMCQAQQRED